MILCNKYSTDLRKCFYGNKEEILKFEIFQFSIAKCSDLIRENENSRFENNYLLHGV